MFKFVIKKRYFNKNFANLLKIYIFLKNRLISRNLKKNQYNNVFLKISHLLKKINYIIIVENSICTDN